MVDTQVSSYPQRSISTLPSVAGYDQAARLIDITHRLSELVTYVEKKLAFVIVKKEETPMNGPAIPPQMPMSGLEEQLNVMDRTISYLSRTIDMVAL